MEDRELSEEENPTEPVVEGLRSNCCGATTETIFFVIVFLHLVPNDDEGKEERSKSF